VALADRPVVAVDAESLLTVLVPREADEVLAAGGAARRGDGPEEARPHWSQ
jgi:hypothetical protein